MNSSFSNPHDDPINVHGTFLQVVEKISDTKIKVRYMHNETAGFPSFFVGDQVEFMTKGDMLPVSDSVRTVTAVDGPDGQGGDMGAGSGSLTDIVSRSTAPSLRRRGQQPRGGEHPRTRPRSTSTTMSSRRRRPAASWSPPARR